MATWLPERSGCSAAGLSGAGCHCGAQTNPGSIRSQPRKNWATCARVRRVTGVAVLRDSACSCSASSAPSSVPCAMTRQPTDTDSRTATWAAHSRPPTTKKTRKPRRWARFQLPIPYRVQIQPPLTASATRSPPAACRARPVADQVSRSPPAPTCQYLDVGEFYEAPGLMAGRPPRCGGRRPTPDEGVGRRRDLAQPQDRVCGGSQLVLHTVACVPTQSCW